MDLQATLKGAAYSHRAAYLNTAGEILKSDLSERIVFICTANVFQANRWGFMWAVPAFGGANVCLRNVNTHTYLSPIWTIMFYSLSLKNSTMMMTRKLAGHFRIRFMLTLLAYIDHFLISRKLIVL